MAPKFAKGTKNQRAPSDLLNLFPSTGYGCSVVPPVICLQKQFPDLFVGNWFCFHGDGTSHGPLTLTPVGSPTTQTLSTCGNGMYAAPVTRQRLDVDKFQTTSIAQPTGDFSAAACFINDAPTSTGDLVVKDNGSTDRAFSFRVRNDGAVYSLFGTDTTANHYALAPTSSAPGGAEVFACSTYQHIGAGNVNTLNMYINGVAGGSATQAPEFPVSTAAWTIGGSSANLIGAVRCAFLTEKCLTQADITNIQNYLFPQPRGTRGEPLTFTRNSLASCTAPDGTLTWLPPNRPAISGGIKMRPSITNLLLWSEDFSNAIWVSGGPTFVVSANTATAPDGSMTADTLAATGGATAYTKQTFTANGGAYTTSIWVKANTGANTFSLRIFDTTSSTEIARTDFIPTDVWQRIVCTTSTTISGHGLYIQILPTGLTTNVGSVFAWGAQLETGTMASDYIRSEGTQGVQAGEACTVPMPGVRTNLALWSEDFSQSNWVKYAQGDGQLPVVTANAAVAPDGSLTSDRIDFSISDPAVAGSVAQIYHAGAVQIGETRTFSIWLKTVDGNDITIDLSTATQERPTVVTGEWKRYSVTGTAVAFQANMAYIRVGPNWTGSNSASVYAWGAQVETGPAATDYIPTTSAPASVSSLSTKEGSAQVSIVPTWTGGPPAALHYLSARSSDGSRLGYGNKDADLFLAYAGGGLASVPAGYVKGLNQHYLTKWSVATGELTTANMTTGVVGAAQSFSGFASFDSTLSIGSQPAGFNQPFGATLSDIIFSKSPKK